MTLDDGFMLWAAVRAAIDEFSIPTEKICNEHTDSHLYLSIIWEDGPDLDLLLRVRGAGAQRDDDWPRIGLPRGGRDIHINDVQEVLIKHLDEIVALCDGVDTFTSRDSARLLESTIESDLEKRDSFRREKRRVAAFLPETE